MEGPRELRMWAVSYRRLALSLTDSKVIQALKELAEEYEALAEAMEVTSRPPGMKDSEGRGSPERG